jgi:hypothetical protein
MRPFLNPAYIAVLIALIALIAVRSREEDGDHPSAINTGVFNISLVWTSRGFLARL